MPSSAKPHAATLKIRGGVRLIHTAEKQARELSFNGR